ncbi:hypothetical protein D3C74_498680 [compost metagenome]
MVWNISGPVPSRTSELRWSVISSLRSLCSLVMSSEVPIMTSASSGVLSIGQAAKLRNCTLVASPL